MWPFIAYDILQNLDKPQKKSYHYMESICHIRNNEGKATMERKGIELSTLRKGLEIRSLFSKAKCAKAIVSPSQSEEDANSQKKGGGLCSL